MQKNKKIWSFEDCQTLDFKQELSDNYKQKGRFYEDVNNFYEHLGILCHPSLKAPPGKEYTEPNIINFLNVLIDINTIKTLFALFPTSRIIDIKFNNNLFEFSNLEFMINQFLTKPTNIFSVVFEWNSKIKYRHKDENQKEETSEIISFDALVPENESIGRQAQLLIAKFASVPKLEALCLRGNMLSDEAGIQIMNYLKDNTTIRVLNLYKNNFTSAIIPSFLSMIENNKKLEELNLGANHFVDDDLLGLKDLLGKIAISNEDAEAIQKKARDREMIIEKNKKLKNQKKPEEPLPIVEDINQIGEVWYIVRNNRIKNLNLMLNNFTKNCYETLTYFFDVADELFITIDGKVFSLEQRERLIDPRQKYSSRVYLTK